MASFTTTRRGGRRGKEKNTFSKGILDCTSPLGRPSLIHSLANQPERDMAMTAIAKGTGYYVQQQTRQQQLGLPVQQEPPGQRTTVMVSLLCKQVKKPSPSFIL